jgi:DNA gyrase subunit A
MDVHQIPADDTSKSLGELTGFKGKDGVAAVLALPRERRDGDGGCFFLVSERGVVKRVNVLDAQINTAGEFSVFNVEDGDRLGWALHTTGSQEVILVTAEGQSIRFGEDEVRVMGLAAGGVGGIKLRGKDRLVHAAVADPAGELLTISATGFAKRTALAEYSSQGRNGGGILAHKLVERTGKLTAALALPPRTEGDQVILVSGKGVAKPLPVTDLPRMGRAASGKQVLTLAERDTVVAAWHIGLSAPQGAPEGGGTNDDGTASDGAVASPAPAPRKVAARPSVAAEQVELLAEAAPVAAAPGRGKTAPVAAPLPIKQVAGGAKPKPTVVAASAPAPAAVAAEPLPAKAKAASKKQVSVAPAPAPAAAAGVEPTPAKGQRKEQAAAAPVAVENLAAENLAEVKPATKAAPARKGKSSARPTPAEIARGTRGASGTKEPAAPRFDFGEEEPPVRKSAGGTTTPRKLDVVVSVTKTQAGAAAEKDTPTKKGK